MAERTVNRKFARGWPNSTSGRCQRSNPGRPTMRTGRVGADPVSISASSPGTNGFGSGSASARPPPGFGSEEVSVSVCAPGFRQRATVSGGIGRSR